MVAFKPLARAGAVFSGAVAENLAIASSTAELTFVKPSDQKACIAVMRQRGDSGQGDIDAVEEALLFLCRRHLEAEAMIPAEQLPRFRD